MSERERAVRSLFNVAVNAAIGGWCATYVAAPWVDVSWWRCAVALLLLNITGCMWRDRFQSHDYRGPA